MHLKDDSHCFVCGMDNLEGLRIDWEVVGQVMKGSFICQKKYQGWKGIVHGGILATLLDEAMTRLAGILYGGAVTAEMTVLYVNPAPTIQDRLKLLLSPLNNMISTSIYNVKAACIFLVNNYNQENIFLVKYEDIIPKDVNSEDSCIELAWYLGYSCSREFIQQILNKSVGKSNTFRKGKKGDWKKHFDEDLKALFKAVLGDELILLGCESDYNW